VQIFNMKACGLRERYSPTDAPNRKPGRIVNPFNITFAGLWRLK
jgi:hypothetical protein